MIGEVVRLALVVAGGVAISRWGVRTSADVWAVILVAAVLGVATLPGWLASVYLPLALVVSFARLGHFDRAAMERIARRYRGAP